MGSQGNKWQFVRLRRTRCSLLQFGECRKGKDQEDESRRAKAWRNPEMKSGGREDRGATGSASVTRQRKLSQRHNRKRRESDTTKKEADRKHDIDRKSGSERKECKRKIFFFFREISEIEISCERPMAVSASEGSPREESKEKREIEPYGQHPLRQVHGGNPAQRQGPGHLREEASTLIQTGGLSSGITDEALLGVPTGQTPNCQIHEIFCEF